MAEKNERDLEEVERALSVLGGRHPKQVRASARRPRPRPSGAEEHEAQARRRPQARDSARYAIGVGRARRRPRDRLLRGGVHSARAAIDARSRRSSRAHAAGFDALPRGAFAPQDRAEVTTVAGDCYAFVAAHGAQMSIERPVGSAGAQGRPRLHVRERERRRHGDRRRAPFARSTSRATRSAARARSPTDSKSPPTVVAGDDACADDALAAFARDKRYAETRDRRRVARRRTPRSPSSGFTTVASAPASLPFAFVEPARRAASSPRERTSRSGRSRTRSKSRCTEKAPSEWCAGRRRRSSSSTWAASPRERDTAVTIATRRRSESAV